MKRIFSVILLIVLLFQFHLSPEIVEASTNQDLDELEIEIIEELEIEEAEETDETNSEGLQESEQEETPEVLVDDEVEESLVEDKSIDNEVDSQNDLIETEENLVQPTMTLMSINVEQTSVLREGVRHADVKKLKSDLEKLGFPVPGNGTTLYGKETAQKVREFQSYYKLQVDGIAGPGTLAKIESILSSPLQNGKRHTDTIKLKADLGKVGFKVPGNGTSLYGNDTVKRVKDFQKHYGLTVNGIADEVTLKKLASLVSSLPTGLQNGVRHNDVKKLKSDLGKLGFPVSGNGTTYYGDDTEQKVKEFQSYYVLSADGIAGKSTLAKIESILSSPLQNGKRHTDTIKLKADLGKVGFKVPGKGTNLYGKDTEKIVIDFQKHHGLRVNGIADEVTLKKIESLVSALPTGLQNGVRHNDVKKLKEDLGRLGFLVPGNGTTFFGADTEQKVRDFQTYYGLIVSGVADEATLAKIKTTIDSPLQNGRRHANTIKLKDDLAKVGFPVPGDRTTYFGKGTEKQVKAYQKFKLLPVSGIADEGTLNAIADDIKKLQAPTYTKYDVTQEQALTKQMNQLQQTDKYRNEKAYIHADYVNFIGHISANNSNLRSKPDTSSTREYSGLGLGIKVAIVKEIEGESFRDSSVWYEVIYKNKTVYAHSSILNPSTTVAETTAGVNVRAAGNTSSHIYDTLAKGTEVTILTKGSTWHEIRSTTWRNPTRNDVLQYINPANNDEFQHLLLSSSVGVSASQLNNVLNGQGVLNGLGQAFIDGGTAHSVNEIYLISHAFLETGYGSSILSNGSIRVGTISKNKFVSFQPNGTYIAEYNEGTKKWTVKKDNNFKESNATNIRNTFNIFGIGAVDSHPNTLGSIRAYQENWFTSKAAVVGGAKFIGERYIHNVYQQNTLYKMRWNPANPGYPQYATDIAWAVKQVNQIQNMYKLLENPLLQFNFVQYK